MTTNCGVLSLFAIFAIQAVVACSSADITTRAASETIEAEMRYFKGTTDLNGDGSPEVIAHVVGLGVCGTGGCPTVVLSPDKNGYRVVTKISITHPPIQVSSKRTNGWRNLLVYVSGGGIYKGYVAELQFDGTTYPENPTVSLAKHATDIMGAETLISDFDSFTDGKRLIAP